ncbi:MAG: AI-2E family transporter [Oscillospiraceae bacterium]|nr:AI-2E family transporter [Oscillospiraceae bacterium]
MKVEFNKKYTTISIYTIITFAICLLMIVLIQKSEVIAGYLKEIARVLAPVTWGIVIAYIANPIMVWFERKLKKVIEKKKKHPKIVRVLSVAISIILLVAILTSLIAILLPQVIDSIVGIISNFSVYMDNLENSIYTFFEDYPDISNFVESQFESIQPKIVDFVNNIMPSVANIAVKLKDGAVGIIIGLKDFLIGFIVAIYLLFSKEKFLGQMRKCVIAVFPKQMSNSVLGIAAHTNQTLSGFISGKLLDSLVIGILCFICMTIMKMEFVALISVVVGITNIIPFFGPFFGAIPSAVLLLVAAPKQVIPFIIFILILQQFDGNILGPKILGDSTGLSAFWVMFAIFIGGGLFGFAGMVLGVPVFAVVYTLVSDFINFLLKKKGLSTATADYIVYHEEKTNKKETSQPPRQNYFEDIFKKKTEVKTENTEEKTDENKDNKN